MYEVFRDIQDMYVRLVSMLVKECEAMLGKPPCKYAIIALGSVARMEATPFSDLDDRMHAEKENIHCKILIFVLNKKYLFQVINYLKQIISYLPE